MCDIRGINRAGKLRLVLKDFSFVAKRSTGGGQHRTTLFYFVLVGPITTQAAEGVEQ
jgi:hypothetical protein